MPRSCQTSRAESFSCHPPWQILIEKVSWTFVRAQMHASWIIWTINRVVTLKTESPPALLESPEDRGPSEEHNIIPWNPNQPWGIVFLSGDFTVRISSPSSSARPCRYFTLEMKALRSKFPSVDCRLASLRYLLGSLERLRGGSSSLTGCPGWSAIPPFIAAGFSGMNPELIFPKRMLTLTTPQGGLIWENVHIFGCSSVTMLLSRLSSQEAWSQGDVSRLDCECLRWFWHWLRGVDELWQRDAHVSVVRGEVHQQ